MKFLLTLTLYIVLFTITNVFAQKVNERRLEIFIDCNYCDFEFIKTQLPFINIVRERKAADIYLLFNRNRTGSGGFENTIIAHGDSKFKNIIDTTTYFTEVTDNYELERLKMTNGIKASIIRFLVYTPLKTDISYNIGMENKNNVSITDKWDNWIFRIRLRNSFWQEESNHSLQIYSSLSAKRVTENLKFIFDISNDYKENFYAYEDVDVLNINRAQYLRAYAIHSLSDHWSIGLWSRINSSSYSNIDFNLSIAPGIEYNIFPYSDYTSRQFRIDYKLELSKSYYIQKTIYLKAEENLMRQSLSVAFDLIKTWGSIGLDVSGSQYLHNLSFYSIDFSSRVSLNLVRGLSIDFNGFASAIHDQLNLPIDDASLEDVLLRRRELATEFKFRGSIGFSFFFGSILNNVVNPRFGN